MTTKVKIDAPMSVEDSIAMQHLYRQDFINEFGDLSDGTDKAVIARRLQTYAGLTVLSWVTAGSQLPPVHYGSAFEMRHFMSYATRSHLVEFLETMKNMLPAWSLKEAQALELLL